jgi:hypothetical protein
VPRDPVRTAPLTDRSGARAYRGELPGLASAGGFLQKRPVDGVPRVQLRQHIQCAVVVAHPAHVLGYRSSTQCAKIQLQIASQQGVDYRGPLSLSILSIPVANGSIDIKSAVAVVVAHSLSVAGDAQSGCAVIAHALKYVRQISCSNTNMVPLRCQIPAAQGLSGRQRADTGGSDQRQRRRLPSPTGPGEEIALAIDEDTACR